MRLSHTFMRFLPILLLAGCATEVVTKPEVVQVPVEVSRPCPALGQVGPPPPLKSDAELLALDDHGFVLTLAEERALLAAYASLAAPAIEACQR